MRLDAFAQWAMLLEMPEANLVPPLATQPPDEIEPPPSQPTPVPSQRQGAVLQKLVCKAPLDFRCAYDGQLMMDPVRSPHGHVFDRASLALALAERQGVCPFTRCAMSVEDCARLPDLRRRIAKWIREQHSAERAKPRLPGAAR